MKTNTSNKVEELGSRSAQSVETTTAVNTDTAATPAPEQKPDNQERSGTLPPIDTEARKKNRTLPTPKVLAQLHQQIPAAYRLAEVVGRWVWVTFKEQPAAELRQQLSQLGFHWNRERQTWQHPCGQFSLGSSTDPHAKYSAYRPAAIRNSRKQQPQPKTAEATA
jgi:hypothetical protein